MELLRALGLDFAAQPSCAACLQPVADVCARFATGHLRRKDAAREQVHCHNTEEQQKQIWESQQLRLREQLRVEDDAGWSSKDIRRVGGLDISFETGTSRGTAVLVVVEFVPENPRQLRLLYEDAIDVDMQLPYVSGFLFVRELPGYQELLRRLRRRAPAVEPDIFLVDGSGVYHPRYFGSASHLGVVENLRTIGIAKKTMVLGDDFDWDAGHRVEEAELPNLGDSVELVGTKTHRVYGMALRTSRAATTKKGRETSAKRVYISVGHRLSLATAKDVVLRCSDVEGGSYIPEPIRLADLSGRAIERVWQQLHQTSPPCRRQFVLDVSNLLDDGQRRTLHGMLQDRAPEEKLADIPAAELKRRKQVVTELFEPFQAAYGAVTVAEVRAAMKMDKPWAVALQKGAFLSKEPGAAMSVEAA